MSLISKAARVLASHSHVWPQRGKTTMVIADRLRALREEKNLSQGDIEKRTGLTKWTCAARSATAPISRKSH
jgi:hypothetical protein